MLLAGCFSLTVQAQKECATQHYQENSVSPQTSRIIEDFISRAYTESRVTAGLIRIPVVVHNLYHYPGNTFIHSTKYLAQLGHGTIGTSTASSTVGVDTRVRSRADRRNKYRDT